MRQFFKLLYHQLAWTYDFVAWVVSVGKWQGWVTSVTPYLPGPRTLEIGFGPGHLQEALYKKGIKAIGLDESRQMTRITWQRLTRQGLKPKLVQGDALTLPFARQSFNQVVMTFPAEYILAPSTLGEVHRVLVDGGAAIFLPVAWITGGSPFERFAAWLNRVTGEAPKWREESLEPFKNNGFQLNWEMIDLRSSKVLVVRMVKSIPGTTGSKPV